MLDDDGNLIETQSADLIFCHGYSWLTQAIRWAERGKNESASNAAHVAGIIEGNLAEEALTKVVAHAYNKTNFPGTHYVYRNTKLTQVQRDLIVAEAEDYIGRTYGYLKILTQLGDALLQKAFGGSIYAFRRLTTDDKYPICSWVWAYAYYKAINYTFGIKPQEATPDDMLDFVQGSSDWELVGKVTVDNVKLA